MWKFLFFLVLINSSNLLNATSLPIGQNLFYPNYSYNDCITCGANANLYSRPMYYGTPNQYNMFAGGYTNPWWAQYGGLSYPNFNYPGAWSNHGMRGQSYAGHGTMFAGKPNVYVSAPNGTTLKAKIVTSDMNNLLLTVPAHGDNGWNGVVLNNKFVVESSEHDYLFYDIRFDHNDFLADTGFCGDRQFSIEEMMRSMQAIKFKEQELKDFYEYWSVKLPKSESYCIFPQFNEENDKAYKLVVTDSKNSPIKLTRVTFAVVLNENLKKSSSNKFFMKPKNQTAYKEKIKKISKSSQENIEIREWAVAFLTN